MKPFLSLVASATLLCATEYKIDLMDDVFGLDLYDLKALKVTSASKSAQTLNFTPARMIVISKEQIEDRGYRGLDELLNDLPSIQVMRYADSGILNQIGIRGVMGTNYFKVLQDGIEIDQSDGEILSHSMQYPLMGIERVEVIYGPSSVVYGADALSGVINLVSAKAPENVLTLSGGRGGYRYGSGVVSTALGEGRLNLKAHYHQDQDYDLEKEYPSLFILSSRNNEFDFQPHISKSLSARYEEGGFELGANYRYSSESTLIAMNQGNSTSNIFDNNANLDTAIWGVYGRYTGRIFDTLTSVTTLSYDTTELLQGSYFINKYTAYKPGYKYSKSERYSLEETLSTTVENHHILFGVSHEWFESIPMTIDLPTPSLSGPIYFAGSTIEAPIYDIKWRNSALYLQDQIALSENLQLSIAGRLDDSSEYGSSFNPRLALIHSTEALTHKWIYSQAYLAPSNYQKYKIYGNPLQPNTQGDGNAYQTARYRVANPDLQPEKSKNIEYNLEWYLSPNDQLGFSIYYTTINDIISNEESLPGKSNFIPNTTILPDPSGNNGPVGAANSTKAIIYGGDISYQGHSFFSGYDVSYWANYSYVDGTIDYEYNYSLPYSATHVLKSGGTLRYGDWRISPSMRWVSPIMAAPFKDSNNNVVFAKENGHFVTNLYGSYAFDKQKKLSFKIDNLFDKHYYGVRYNSSSKYLSPQDARMFSIALTINL